MDIIEAMHYPSSFLFILYLQSLPMNDIRPILRYIKSLD